MSKISENYMVNVNKDIIFGVDIYDDLFVITIYNPNGFEQIAVESDYIDEFIEFVSDIPNKKKLAMENLDE